MRNPPRKAHSLLSSRVRVGSFFNFLLFPPYLNRLAITAPFTSREASAAERLRSVLTSCYENRVQRADGFTRSGSFLLECDGIAETLQAMNEVSSEVMFVEFVEVEIP